MKNTADDKVAEIKKRVRRQVRLGLLSEISGIIGSLDDQRDPSTEEEIVETMQAYLTIYREDTSVERQPIARPDDDRYDYPGPG